MNDKKICPLAEKKECEGCKCSVWVDETIPARSKKCEKELNASDVMSSDDFALLVKLSMAVESLNVGYAQCEAKLASLGEKSLLHPFRSGKIDETISEMKRQKAAVFSGEKRIKELIFKYEKVASMVAVDLLRLEGWKKSYLSFREDRLIWKIGGVKVIEAVKKGRCGLTTEYAEALLANKKVEHEKDIQN